MQLYYFKTKDSLTETSLQIKNGKILSKTNVRA